MTAKEFVAKIEAYYGRYEDHIKRYVYGYINSELAGQDLRRIYEYLVLTYSRVYRMAPDIAKIADAVDKSKVQFYGDEHMIGTPLEHDYVIDPLEQLHDGQDNRKQIEGPREKPVEKIDLTPEEIDRNREAIAQMFDKLPKKMGAWK